MMTMAELRKMTRRIKADVPVNVSMRMPNGTVVIGEPISVLYDNSKMTIQSAKTSKFKGRWVFYPDVRISKLESVAQTVSMLKGVPVSEELAAVARESYQSQDDSEGGAL